MRCQQEPTGDDGLLLRLDGAVTVENAEELCQILREALAAAPRVRVELATDCEADTAGLQLFCAAHRTALANGNRFTLKAQTPENFRATLQNAGLLRSKGCRLDPDNQCIWLGANHG